MQSAYKDAFICGKRKRTPGSTMLRIIMSKFNRRSDTATLESSGGFFSGMDPPPLTAEEERLRKRRPHPMRIPMSQSCVSKHLTDSPEACSHVR